TLARRKKDIVLRHSSSTFAAPGDAPGGALGPKAVESSSADVGARRAMLTPGFDAASAGNCDTTAPLESRRRSASPWFDRPPLPIACTRRINVPATGATSATDAASYPSGT